MGRAESNSLEPLQPNHPESDRLLAPGDMRRTEKISDAMATTLADEFGVLAEVLKALARRSGGH